MCACLCLDRSRFGQHVPFDLVVGTFSWVPSSPKAGPVYLRTQNSSQLHTWSPSLYTGSCDNTSAKSFQKSLVKEYALNHIGIAIMV